MNRRAFLARVTQLVAGATVAAAMPALLKTAAPATLEHAQNLSEIEADLMHMWNTYSCRPDTIIVSPDLYEELVGLYGAEPGSSHILETEYVKIVRDEYFPPKTARKFNLNFFNPAPPTAFQPVKLPGWDRSVAAHGT